MGAAASVSIDDVKTHPQFTILGAEKIKEVFGENSSVTLVESSKVDPYLKYGGAYKGDPKDSKDFHYVIYDELPKVSRRYFLYFVLTVSSFFIRLHVVRS